MGHAINVLLHPLLALLVHPALDELRVKELEDGVPCPLVVRAGNLGPGFDEAWLDVDTTDTVSTSRIAGYDRVGYAIETVVRTHLRKAQRCFVCLLTLGNVMAS